MTLHIKRCLCFCSKTRKYQYFDVCCPETSSCASKPLLLRCNLVIPQCMCHVLLKNREYQYFDVCCPKTSSCASKPLLLRCNLVITQCMCKVSLRLKEVQMETGNINTSMSATPKLALVPASRNYCDITL